MMNKYLKIFLISILTAIGLLTLTLVLVYQNIDTLKKYALEELNKHLKTPLETKAISVSVFSTFPMVSLELSQVRIKDPLRKNINLIEAQRLFLGFNLMDVINKNYKVQLIQLDSGSLNLYVTKNGKQNFDLLKTETQTSKSTNTAFSFQVNKVGLNQIRIQYEDKSAATHLDVFSIEAFIGGKFSDKNFDMELKLTGISNDLQFGTLSLFKQKNINLNLSLKVDNSTNKYEINRGEFAINTLFLHLKGDMVLGSKKSDYNLSFSADKITIQDLISVLPIQMPEKIKDYASQGEVFFKGSYKGKQTKDSSPSLFIDFGIASGSLTDPESGLMIDQINLKGTYTGNNNLADAKLAIPSLSAHLPGSNLNGNLLLTNLINPQIFAELTGSADLNKVNEFFKFEDVKSLSGKLDFTFTVKGNKKDSAWIWDPSFSQGLFNLNIPELSLDYLSKPFKNINLEAALNGSALEVKQLSFLIGESDFSLLGTFPSIFNAFGKNNKQLIGDLKLNCNSLNVNDLLVYNSDDPKEEGDEGFDYKIKLGLAAKKFTSNKFIATNLNCRAVLLPNRTEMPYFSLQTCTGSFAGEATWQLEQNGYVLKANHQANHIDLSQLLASFDNFGQNEITSNHLKGFLSAQTDMIIYFDPKLKVDLNKLLLVTAMNIKQGELIDYKPLLGLSKFADVEELKHLKFSELQNTLTIKSSVITIPEMDIRSNAFNLGFSGKHTFENQVNYRVKLALSQLIKKKRKIQPNEFGEEDPISKNWIIYVNIDGPLNNLKYSFDRKDASKKLKEEVKKEGESIKEILKQEFQIKKDSSLKKVETNNNNPNELEFEEE